MTAAPPPQDAEAAEAAAADVPSRPGDGVDVRVGVLDGLVLVVWSVVSQVVAFTAMALAGVDVGGLSGVSAGAAIVVSQSVTLTGALAWLAGRGRLSMRLLGTRRPRLSDVPVGIGAGLLTFGLAAGALLTVDALLGPLDEAGQQLLDDSMLVGGALVMNLVATAFMAPLIEEIVFRGVLFESLGRHVPWGMALLYAGLFFGLVHLEVLLPFTRSAAVYGVALIGVGMLFGVVLRRSRSLLVAMVAHGTFNAVQVLLAAQDLTGA